MKTYDEQGDAREVSPKEWLKDAYLRCDEALDPLLQLSITKEQRQEMEDYLKETDDELGKAIWLMVYSDHKSWVESD